MQRKVNVQENQLLPNYVNRGFAEETLLTDIRSKELTNGKSWPAAGEQIFWLWAGGSSINRVSVQDLQMKSETLDLVYRVGEDQ